jgi:hypothetical protein
MMKSQAVAFLLGFALTSVVLLFVPGMSKRTSHAGTTGDNKLAGVISTQNTTAGDSTVVTSGHFNTIPVLITP